MPKHDEFKLETTGPNGEKFTINLGPFDEVLEPSGNPDDRVMDEIFKTWAAQTAPPDKPARLGVIEWKARNGRTLATADIKSVSVGVVDDEPAGDELNCNAVAEIYPGRIVVRPAEPDGCHPCFKLRICGIGASRPEDIDCDGDGWSGCRGCARWTGFDPDGPEPDDAR